MNSGMAQSLTGASSMQAGILVNRGPRYVSYLILTIGIILINILMWSRIIIDAMNQHVLSSTSLLATALASTLALGLVVSLWRSPLSANHRMLQTPALRHTLATHHAGHIVAAHLADPDRIRRISLTEPCNHHHSVVPVVTETALRMELTIALGGIVADEVFSGESGTHSAADLERATEIAADMVGRYGMSGSLLSLLPIARRRRHLVAWVIEDARTRKDLETVLRQAKKDTIRSMLENRHELVAVRDALVRHDRLSAAHIRSIIASADQRRSRDDEVLVDLRVVTGRPAAGAYR